MHGCDLLPVWVRVHARGCGEMSQSLVRCRRVSRARLPEQQRSHRIREAVADPFEGSLHAAAPSST